MTQYFSHIRRDAGGQVVGRTRLADHLAAVARAASGALAGGSDADQAALFVGLCHDFGKMTTFFQSYLETGKPHPHALQQHAFISALYGAFETYRMLATMGTENQQWDGLLVYLAIKHHHGNLANLTDDVGIQWIRDGAVERITNNLADPLGKAQYQVADLLQQGPAVANELETAITHIASDLPKGWQPDVSAFLAGEWMETFNRLVRDARQYERGHGQHQSYVRQLTMFSALIDADKRHAAQVQSSERPVIPQTIIDVYVAAKVANPPNDAQNHVQAASEMNAVRQQLYARSTERVRRWADKAMFTLTAPTGSGKTLTALSTAMILRERVISMGRPAPRVIYAMPFTSIIDQNHEVLQKALSQLDAFAAHPYRYLVAHHHLAPVKAQDDGRELPVDEALLLQEGWDSEFVVTTFVQLFDTLIGYRNRALKRFHRVQNAILILDEVQSLPAELWPLVGNVLHLMAEQCGTKVILMTATQPKLLHSTLHSVELAGDPDEVAALFNRLDRIDLHIELAPITSDDFVTRFIERYRPDRSYLLVFNTIRTSLEVFQKLKCSNQLDVTAGLTYLSSNVVPSSRRVRVKELTRAGRAGVPMVIVSTQVVEAGVDLDVDVVYRELAPVDAMVQAAGRCNRDNAGVEKGRVYVVPLQPTSGRRSSMERVYGLIKAHATTTTLQKVCGPEGRCVLPESAFPELVSDYFTALDAQESKGNSQAIWRSMDALHFSPAIGPERPVVCDFRLIKEYPQYVDLFVTCTRDAEELWDWYQTSVVSERDLLRRRKNYLARKAEFQGYIISVHKQRAHSLGAEEQRDGALWYLPSVVDRQDIYDPITGLVFNPNDVDSFV